MSSLLEWTKISILLVERKENLSHFLHTFTLRSKTWNHLRKCGDWRRGRPIYKSSQNLLATNWFVVKLHDFPGMAKLLGYVSRDFLKRLRSNCLLISSRNLFSFESLFFVKTLKHFRGLLHFFRKTVLFWSDSLEKMIKYLKDTKVFVEFDEKRTCAQKVVQQSNSL